MIQLLIQTGGAKGGMNLLFISCGLLLSLLPWHLPEPYSPHHPPAPRWLKVSSYRMLLSIPKSVSKFFFPPQLDLNLVIQEMISRLEGGQPTTTAITASFSHHLKAIDEELSLTALDKYLTPLELPAMAAINAAITYSRILGTPIAEVLKHTSTAITDMLNIINQQKTAIAAPRMSSRLLLLLPLVGIGFGRLLGADPIASFTDGKIGTLAFISGIFLWLLGWLWWRKILRQAGKVAQL